MTAKKASHTHRYRMPRYLARTFSGVHVVQDIRSPDMGAVSEHATLGEAITHAARLNSRTSR